MARRPKKNDIPKRTKPSVVTFANGEVKQPSPYVTNNSRRAGQGGGLTTNRSKPGGGHGSAGPTTSVG